MDVQSERTYVNVIKMYCIDARYIGRRLGRTRIDALTAALWRFWKAQKGIHRL